MEGSMNYFSDADKLKAKFNGRVVGHLYTNYPIKKISWFRVGGCAELLFKPKDLNDLKKFMRIKPRNLPVTILGGASNTLIRDYGIPGVVIVLDRAFNYIKQTAVDTIECGAAVPSKKISNFALKNNLGGLSFLNTIPGTFGGAVKMNSGAYGAEVADILISARFINNKGNELECSPADICYGYRSSNISDDMICISAIIKGSIANKDEIIKEINRYKKHRDAAQPIKERTGGSTFKNPVDIKAWELIRDSGCSGLSSGDAIISGLHTNFIINKGNATAHDIELLGEKIKKRVKEKTGIDLEWEIRRIGNGPKVEL
ncbi:MAG: UDP-N-acetylenolpyruvoylglucosamine reductase [Rhodobiaceae bacterium]|nr:UDP-N-acetylenolpyruvoylglucosamine reductase [Rhodobiaceae bacterium]